jgi:3-isopropylmalate/(R)-2-methylmalate dehydratase small subunit
MNTHLTGHAWCFGGLLDVDWELCPRRVKEEFHLRGGEITDEDFGRYCMHEVDPTFAERVGKGDFRVGEQGFGYGHDHDHASRSIKGCGVAAVLCESSTPYFLRNSFNHGLLVLDVPGIFAATSTGDVLEVDLELGSVTNSTTGWNASFPKIPDFLLELIDAGDIVNLVKAGK